MHYFKFIVEPFINGNPLGNIANDIHVEERDKVEVFTKVHEMIMDQAQIKTKADELFREWQ